MAPVEQLARKLNISVSDDGLSWTNLGGENNVRMTPVFNNEDVSTFDDAGYGRMLDVSAQYTLNIEGIWHQDTADGSLDPGLSIIEDHVGLFGSDGLMFWRIDGPNAVDALTFRGKPSRAGDFGGTNNEHIKFNFSVPMYGYATGANGVYTKWFPDAPSVP